MSCEVDVGKKGVGGVIVTTGDGAESGNDEDEEKKKKGIVFHVKYHWVC